MLVPNRHSSAESYRYGFQGQEKDDEVKGEGNSINYTFRMHDPRVGRFFARDPLAYKYHHYSPYQFSGNRVLDKNELEGLETGPTYTEVLLLSRNSGLSLQQSSNILYNTEATTKFVEGFIDNTVYFVTSIDEAWAGASINYAIGQSYRYGGFEQANYLKGISSNMNTELGSAIGFSFTKGFFNDKAFNPAFGSANEGVGFGRFVGGALNFGMIMPKVISVLQKLPSGQYGPSIQLFRGTDRYLELKIMDETGYILSKAAQTKYMETKNISEALKHADDVHNQWIKIFGSEAEYARQHAIQGLELEIKYGLERTLISTTEIESTAIIFAGEGGTTFKGTFEVNKVIKQTLETSTESEFLIKGGTNLLKQN